MRSQYRAYVMVGDILDHALNGRHAVATALLVQAHKSLLQMAIDAGSWENARLLWPEPDSMAPEEFGGSDPFSRFQWHRPHQHPGSPGSGRRT
jgi:hypothetical protein